jgi:uncharacterized membrane protein YccC
LKITAVALAARRAEMRLAVRVAVAGAASFAAAGLVGLAQGYWAVFTAVIVMQASVGGSLQATIDRMIGTIGGALIGAIVAVALPTGDPIAQGAAVAIALLPLAFVAAIDSRFRVAPVTAVIVLLSPTGQSLSPLLFTADRVIEIALGSVVALAVSLLILPARAHGLLAEATSKLLNLLADFLVLLVGGLTTSPDPAEVRRLQVASRRTLTRMEGIADEARRERMSFLTDDPDPDPIVRTSLRVRNDLIILARAAITPLPIELGSRLTPALDAIAASGAAYLRELGEAFRHRQPPPVMDAFEAALRAHRSEIDAIRREGTLRALAVDIVGRVFALGFALDQLHQNAHDLADRAAEFARQAGPTRRDTQGSV